MSAADFSTAPLFKALLNRRSRRVGLGMRIPAGPLQYTSGRTPAPLTEEEEAILAFAACGITGYALADLSYGTGEGGGMLASRLGRTVPSPDAVHTVAVVVTNDSATWLLKRPQDFEAAEFPELVRLAKQGAFLELYRRSRIHLFDRRVAPPLDPPHNFPINRWSLHAAGTTYFLPVIETTALLINVLLELFDPAIGIFIRDERAWFRPAGLRRFARSDGGHLHDDPRDGLTATIQALEGALLESMATEQGMVLQNLALATEALGLGGFPNFARHESSWFEALGFRMNTMPASRYAGAPWIATMIAGWFGRDPRLAFPTGLERNGSALLKPFCPPFYDSMEAAVRAFVETKTWAPYFAAPSESAVEATIAYCNYVDDRYGRFPAYTAPFRTVIGFQVCRVDPDFYQRFYSNAPP
jgi:hypothetical protein